MAADVLSDADIGLGGGKPSALPADKPVGVLSDSDIGIGRSARTPAPTKMKDATPPPTTAPHAVKTAADIGDFITAAPGMVMSSLKDFGTRFGLIAAGAPRSEQDRLAKEAAADVPEWLQKPVSTFLGKMGVKLSDSPTVVSNALDIMSKGLERGGEWVEQHTGGVVTKGAFESIVNAEMAAAAGKGTVGATRLGARWVKKGAPEGAIVPPGSELDSAVKVADRYQTPVKQTAFRNKKTGEVIPSGEKHNVELKKDSRLEPGFMDAEGNFLSRKEAAAEVKKVAPEALAEKPSEKVGLHSTDFGPSGVPGAPDLGQAGRADPRLLAGIGLTLAGAYTAQQLASRDKLEAAIAGGAAGALSAIAPRYVGHITENWKSALKTGVTVAGVTTGLTMLDKKHPVEGMLIGLAWGSTRLFPKAKIPMIGQMSVDDLVNLRNGAIAAREREVSNVRRAIQTLVPDGARRAELAQALEKGDLSGLSGHDLKAAQLFRGFMDSYGEAAKNAGVLQDLVQNYVTHVVERTGLPMGRVQEVMQSLFGDVRAAGGVGAKPGFAKHRKYATFDELQNAIEGSGLQVKTMDIAEIAEIYGRSMGRAIENKRMIDNLKAAVESQDPSASPYITKMDKAPAGYVYIDSPQMRGMMVHPDLAPSLRFVLESYNPSDVTRGLLSLSLAQKRLATGLSLFHAQNLFNAYIGAMGTEAVRAKPAIDAALKAYRDGGLGDTTDLLLRNGLRVEAGRPMEADLQAMQKVGALTDSFVNRAFGTKFSGFEKGLGAVERVQRETFDRLTWDYLHTGMKLAVGNRELERAAINPKYKGMPRDQIARQVASFVNDTFGGLDWYRVAAETQSQWGRKMAMSLLSPRGRAKLQILMFAPDWTLSTFRAMYKALPGSSSMDLTRRLHQKYVLRTAAMWATILNGYNMYASGGGDPSKGHSIWDNKDPTKIEWADGTTQQIAKHAMEGPEWLLKPRQTALNKLGIAVKEPMEQLLGQEYLTPEGRAPKIESRVGHLAKAVSPIPVQSAFDVAREPGDTVKRAVGSMLGMPVYGRTKEEKRTHKRRMERENRRKRREDSRD